MRISTILPLLITLSISRQSQGVCSDEDLYCLLEVKPNAKAEAIKKQYRKLAKIWHPDKNLENRQEAEQQFILISKAYEVLSDSDKRQQYDQERLFPRDGKRQGGPQDPSFGQHFSQFGRQQQFQRRQQQLQQQNMEDILRQFAGFFDDDDDPLYHSHTNSRPGQRKRQQQQHHHHRRQQKVQVRQGPDGRLYYVFGDDDTSTADSWSWSTSSSTSSYTSSSTTSSFSSLLELFLYLGQWCFFLSVFCWFVLSACCTSSEGRERRQGVEEVESSSRRRQEPQQQGGGGKEGDDDKGLLLPSLSSRLGKGRGAGGLLVLAAAAAAGRGSGDRGQGGGQGRKDKGNDKIAEAERLLSRLQRAFRQDPVTFCCYCARADEDSQTAELLDGILAMIAVDKEGKGGEGGEDTVVVFLALKKQGAQFTYYDDDHPGPTKEEEEEQLLHNWICRLLEGGVRWEESKSMSSP